MFVCVCVNVCGVYVVLCVRVTGEITFTLIVGKKKKKT